MKRPSLFQKSAAALVSGFVLSAAVLTPIAEATSFPQTRPALLAPSLPPPILPPSTPLLAGGLAPQDVTLRRVSLPPRSARTVIQIEDVHLNAEAQRHIASAVAGAVSRGGARLVALEGAFGEMPLARFRACPAPAILSEAAAAMADQGKIAGVFAAAFLPETAAADFVGVDDATVWGRNVAAYRRASATLPAVKAALAARRADLERRKRATFNDALRRFDVAVSVERAGGAPLSDHLAFLAAHARRVPADAALFLKAAAIEKSLNWSLVDSERARLLSRLASELDAAALRALVDLCLACRTGEIRPAEFYERLSSIASNAGVALGSFPALVGYVRYLTLADAIDADALLADVDAMEDDAYAARAETDPERALIDEDRRLRLEEKLASFSLTPRDWAAYVAGGAGRPEFAPFEAFYRAAAERDARLARNLLNEMDRRHVAVAVLVSGGFHSDGVARRLRAAGVGVVTAQPRLTRVDLAAGSAYLSAFTQEKTPLDRLFSGKKLFLSPEQGTLAQVRMLGLLTATAALLRGAAGAAALGSWLARVWGVPSTRLEAETPSTARVSAGPWRFLVRFPPGIALDPPAVVTLSRSLPIRAALFSAAAWALLSAMGLSLTPTALGLIWTGVAFLLVATSDPGRRGRDEALEALLFSPGLTLGVAAGWMLHATGLASAVLSGPALVIAVAAVVLLDRLLTPLARRFFVAIHGEGTYQVTRSVYLRAGLDLSLDDYRRLIAEGYDGLNAPTIAGTLRGAAVVLALLVAPFTSLPTAFALILGAATIGRVAAFHENVRRHLSNNDLFRDVGLAGAPALLSHRARSPLEKMKSAVLARTDVGTIIDARAGLARLSARERRALIISAAEVQRRAFRNDPVDEAAIKEWETTLGFADKEKGERLDVYFLIGDDGLVHGYILSLPESDVRAKLEEIGTDRQRYGQGSALMHFYIEHLRAAGIRRMWLVASYENARFYRKVLRREGVRFKPAPAYHFHATLDGTDPDPKDFLPTPPVVAPPGPERHEAVDAVAGVYAAALNELGRGDRPAGEDIAALLGGDLSEHIAGWNRNGVGLADLPPVTMDEVVRRLPAAQGERADLPFAAVEQRVWNLTRLGVPAGPTPDRSLIVPVGAPNEGSLRAVVALSHAMPANRAIFLVGSAADIRGYAGALRQLRLNGEPMRNVLLRQAGDVNGDRIVDEHGEIDVDTLTRTFGRDGAMRGANSASSAGHYLAVILPGLSFGADLDAPDALKRLGLSWSRFEDFLGGLPPVSAVGLSNLLRAAMAAWLSA